MLPASVCDLISAFSRGLLASRASRMYKKPEQAEKVQRIVGAALLAVTSTLYVCCSILAMKGHSVHVEASRQISIQACCHHMGKGGVPEVWRLAHVCASGTR